MRACVRAFVRAELAARGGGGGGLLRVGAARHGAARRRRPRHAAGDLAHPSCALLTNLYASAQLSCRGCAQAEWSVWVTSLLPWLPRCLEYLVTEPLCCVGPCSPISLHAPDASEARCLQHLHERFVCTVDEARNAWLAKRGIRDPRKGDSLVEHKARYACPQRLTVGGCRSIASQAVRTLRSCLRAS
eukprot:6201972-Pleurochrysis_carterae.AAC.1